jgi:hypothetical protein
MVKTNPTPYKILIPVIICALVISAFLEAVIPDPFFYGLSKIQGTDYPVVVLVSTSMAHNESWWSRSKEYYYGINITDELFESFPFSSGLEKGDLLFVQGVKPEDIKVGDVLVFTSGKKYPIVSRVIAKDQKGMWVFETKGDNNYAQIQDFELNEKRVLEKYIVGKIVDRVPKLGYVKIFFAAGTI